MRGHVACAVAPPVQVSYGMPGPAPCLPATLAAACDLPLRAPGLILPPMLLHPCGRMPPTDTPPLPPSHPRRRHLSTDAAAVSRLQAAAAAARAGRGIQEDVRALVACPAAAWGCGACDGCCRYPLALAPAASLGGVCCPGACLADHLLLALALFADPRHCRHLVCAALPRRQPQLEAARAAVLQPEVAAEMKRYQAAVRGCRYVPSPCLLPLPVCSSLAKPCCNCTSSAVLLDLQLAHPLPCPRPKCLRACLLPHPPNRWPSWTHPTPDLPPSWKRCGCGCERLSDGQLLQGKERLQRGTAARPEAPPRRALRCAWPTIPIRPACPQVLTPSHLANQPPWLQIPKPNLQSLQLPEPSPEMRRMVR